MSSQPSPIKRETFKEQPYFDKQVVYNEQMLRKFEEKIADSSTAPEQRRQLRHTVFRRRLELLILHYSRGDAVSTLRDLYPPVVEALAAYHREPGHAAFEFETLDAYVYALWLVSLAFLLHVDDGPLEVLLAELDNQG